jgi:hypothetical protein
MPFQWGEFTLVLLWAFEEAQISSTCHGYNTELK